MADQDQTMLRQAILRNAAAVLSLPSAGMLRHHKTRFLGDCPDALGDGVDGIWIEAPTGDLALLNELLDRGDPVGIAFKGAHSSVVFTVPIRRRLDAFKLNSSSEHAMVPALLLPFPTEFKSLQRRAAFRATLQLENPVSLRVWRISEHAVLRDRPMAAAEVQVRARDLSVMGIGFICPPKDNQPPRLTLGERLRLLLKCGDEEVLVEARLIHQRLVGDNMLAAGANFKKLEKDFEGRQMLSKLTTIVGKLQREEIQRQRGELMASTM